MYQNYFCAETFMADTDIVFHGCPLMFDTFFVDVASGRRYFSEGDDGGLQETVEDFDAEAGEGKPSD